MPYTPLLNLLADGELHSGTELGAALGLSRAAVWKQLQQLQELGLVLEARPGRGYRLSQPLDLLNETVILQRLTEAGLTLGHSRIANDIDSSNSYLLKLPRHGASARAWDICLAERQSAGRGRRGRAWHSPFAANIYLSMRREFSQGLSALGGLSLVVGIAVAETIAGMGVPRVRLKWPNDIRIDGAKLGGILIELSGEAGGPCLVVIGLGLNVYMDTGAGVIDQAWTALAEHVADLGRPGAERPVHNRSTLAAALIIAIDRELKRFDQHGFAAFVPRYQALDEFHGQAVTIHGLNAPLHGTVQGVDGQGALCLQTGQGLRTVHAGEVSLRAP